MTPGTAALQREQESRNEDQIFTLLFEQDELSWQNIIMELIKTEQMDPWNVDVSVIADKFIKTLTEMKKMDFRISGKIILAAAFFLKIKSDKLLKEDIVALDSLINPTENGDELLSLLDDVPGEIHMPGEKPVIKIRTPQPRRRKVSVYDLINALEKALEVENKRAMFRRTNVKVALKAPAKTKDMTKIIDELYDKIRETLQKVKVVWFSQLVIGESKMDKVYTFVPLLHLDTQRKIDLEQTEHFGDIKVNLTKLKKQYATPTAN